MAVLGVWMDLVLMEIPNVFNVKQIIANNVKHILNVVVVMMAISLMEWHVILAASME